MKFALASLAIASTLATALPAQAGSATVTLQRTSALVNVDDAAGRWQHEGGNVLRGTSKIGQYALHRRVTTGGTTAPLNTAMTTITLFLPMVTGTAPNNITLQGAHDFTSGSFRGSVSAASNRYTWIQGADAFYSSGTAAGSHVLTIGWTGASQLFLP